MDTKKIESTFQLIKTSIISLDIKNNFIEYDERLNGQKSIDVAYQITDKRVIDTQKLYGGSVDLHITVVSKINEQAFIIQMIYRGIFTAPLSMKQEQFNHMLLINGTTSLYTMARAVIMSISSQMFNGGAILLPMLNMIRFHEYTNPDSAQEKETK